MPSVDVIWIVGTLLGLAGLIVTLVRGLNKRIDTVDKRIDDAWTDVRAVRQEANVAHDGIRKKIDEVRTELTGRIDGVLRECLKAWNERKD